MAWRYLSGGLTDRRSHQRLNIRIPARIFKVSFALLERRSRTGATFIPTSLLPLLDL